jgi:hypothetical protein
LSLQALVVLGVRHSEEAKSGAETQYGNENEAAVPDAGTENEGGQADCGEYEDQDDVKSHQGNLLGYLVAC